ncbi:MAG: SRPBCC family protein [Janthinobacterium lividum]
MVTLRHAIKIAAPRDAVFTALTEPAAMQPWHLGTVEGSFGIGEVVSLTPKPGMTFAWRTDEIDPGEAMLQTCVEGSGSSSGKTLRIAVASLDDGRTLVSLSDGEWDENDQHLPFCNTYWGEALARLRSHLEQTA